MSDFSAIVFDIDGTLLNSEGRLSETNALAVRRCAEAGVVLYVATARSQRLAHVVLEGASFVTERGAFYNGAVAVDRALDYCKHRRLPAELVRTVTHYLADVAPDIQISVHDGDDHHSFRLPIEESVLASWDFSRDELVPFSEASEQECSKVLVWHDKRNAAHLYEDIVNTFGDRVKAILTDSGRLVQVTACNVSKDSALLDLLSLRGIVPEKVVVFGDDTQDIGMFSTFGCSIAMANAINALKESATYVSRSNDEDGVAFALHEYLGII